MPKLKGLEDKKNGEKGKKMDRVFKQNLVKKSISRK